MELTKFQIENFRSIENSGEITVGNLTALVGRNESGKSNLLLALATLNPADGRKHLNKIKDFPRGRRLEECNDETPVVTTHWALSDKEVEKLSKTLGVASPKTVLVGRDYGETPWVEMDVEGPAPKVNEIKESVQLLQTTLAPKIEAIEEETERDAARAIWRRVEALAEDDSGEADAWAADATEALANLRKNIAKREIQLEAKDDEVLTKLEATAKLEVLRKRMRPRALKC